MRLKLQRYFKDETKKVTGKGALRIFFMCLHMSVRVFFGWFVFFTCSCDYIWATASCPLVNVRDLQGNGNERTQHHLKRKQRELKAVL